jgi:glycerol-3-phosphate O-acyltransferase
VRTLTCVRCTSHASQTLFPKLGMLSILIEPCVQAGVVSDVVIAPIAISYEKVRCMCMAVA